MPLVPAAQTPGAHVQRQLGDFYATPPLAVFALLPHLAADLAAEGLIVEPSSGTGHIVRALLDIGVRPMRIMACELDPQRADAAKQKHPYTYCVDTLRLKLDVQPRLIIGNPPYSLTEAFIDWALDAVAPGGSVYYLLRVSVCGGVGRARGFRAWQPRLLFLPGRLSFVHMRKANGRTGTTDMHASAWVHFRKPLPGQSLPALANEWLETDANDIALALLRAGLPVPASLYWRYTPPMLDEAGCLIRAASYGPAAD